MKVAIIGTGYVGLVTGTCLAERGHRVICVDKVKEKTDALASGEVRIYEPGLKEMIDRNMASGRLRFSADGEGAVGGSDIVFIAVGTPAAANGEADLTFVKEAADLIGRAMRGYRVVVNKSTVPVGTTDLVAGIIAKHTPFPFDVVSNPEFLREGAAVEDCMNPDRIVVGVRSERAKDVMSEMYRTFDAPIVMTDPRSAEMIKYASNAFLAVKISFINEVAGLCDQLGADVLEVSQGMGLDPRIGQAFLKAGIGYGGSCFPKDTQALLHMAERVEATLPVLRAAVNVNDRQRVVAVDYLKSALSGLQGKTIGILGLAFKPNTDDVRESPALDIIRHAVREGAEIRAFDPKAMESAKNVLAGEGIEEREAITLCDEALAVADGADALVLVTDWPEFTTLAWDEVRAHMRNPYLFDGRNLLDPTEMRHLGFKYCGIGRGVTSLGAEESDTEVGDVEHVSAS